MTEWERMQKGLVYNDFDQDLFNKRVEAKKLFKAYNKTDDEEIDLRNKIMKQLFKNVGRAKDGEQLLGIIREKEPDVVILDVNLAKISQ